MLSEDAAAVRSSSRLTAVDFDAQVHLVLCEELKMLYVALTRARKRAFLFDSSLERRAPLFDYLAALGVAEQGLERQLSATARKQPKNSVADWQQRAANFEQNKLWTKAEECFLRAGETARALHAGGHRLAAEVKDAQGKVAKAMKLGDLRDPSTAYGPLINEAALQKVTEHCRSALAAGAELLGGGNVHEGLTFQPTVFFEPPRTSSVWTEETFGPVTSVVAVENLDEAIAVANESEYGLSAAILSDNLTQAVAAARRIRCGSVHIGTHSFQSDTMAPIGGFGLSSLGRSGGKYSAEHFTELKWISINNT